MYIIDLLVIFEKVFKIIFPYQYFKKIISSKKSDDLLDVGLCMCETSANTFLRVMTVRYILFHISTVPYT